jgi:adenylyltransferase/sulfurtransferase
MSEVHDVPDISPGDLKLRLDAGDVPMLVDVREHFERRIADLPEVGQLRIPAGEFLHRLEELDGVRPIVLYCRSGSRSAWAVRIMLERGYEEVFNLRGGILGWRAEVDPTLRAY